PIDAELRERLVRDPASMREVERLARVAEDLKRLPIIEPPAGAWDLIAGAARMREPRAYHRPAYWAGAPAVAAGVLTIAALVVAGPWREAPDGTATASGDAEQSAPLERQAALEPEIEQALESEAAAEGVSDVAPGAGPEVAPAIDADYGRLVSESVR